MNREQALDLKDGAVIGFNGISVDIRTHRQSLDHTTAELRKTESNKRVIMKLLDSGVDEEDTMGFICAGELLGIPVNVVVEHGEFLKQGRSYIK